jgi:hypothetical protein
MREFLIVTIYAAFMLLIMAVIIVFIGVTSPINACESHIDPTQLSFAVSKLNGCEGVP